MGRQVNNETYLWFQETLAVIYFIKTQLRYTGIDSKKRLQCEEDLSKTCLLYLFYLSTMLILLNVPLKLLLSCDIVLYVDVYPSETGSQSDSMLQCLTGLHNSQ